MDYPFALEHGPIAISSHLRCSNRVRKNLPGIISGRPTNRIFNLRFPLHRLGLEGLGDGAIDLRIASIAVVVVNGIAHV